MTLTTPETTSPGAPKGGSDLELRSFARVAPPVCGDLWDFSSSLHEALNKVARRPLGDSSQTVTKGRQPHPFNMALADRMVELSCHHAACQNTLIAATLGGGLAVVADEQPADLPPGSLPVIDEERTQELTDRLDSLCEQSWAHEMSQVIGNYWGIGSSYLEVARSGGSIDALYWLPAPNTYKVLATENRKDHFYEALGEAYGERSLFAPFGRIEQTRELLRTSAYVKMYDSAAQARQLTEVIPFLQPTTRWEHYGAPHWGPAAAHIDVDVRSLQRVANYMANGGMPEHLLVFFGFSPTEAQQATLRSVLTGGVHAREGGSAAIFFRNAAKSLADLRHIQLGTDLDHEGYARLHETVNLAVATANQVPPVLAGISTPGKMAASNEQVLAMVTMQRSVIDRPQRMIEAMLRKTLFSTQGGLRGFAGARVRFRTWLEATDIQALNVVARQREQVAESPNRDPKDGLKR